MADVGRGHRFYAQFGKETTYGTPVAATGLRLFGYNWKAKPILGVDEEEALHGGISVREVYQLGRFWEWSFETDFNYYGMLKLFHMICGEDSSPATPAVTGPTANIYTHSFKEGRTMPFYTGEIREGGPGGVSTVSQFSGMQAEKLEITLRSGQSSEARARLKVSGIARNRATGIAPAGLTMVDPRAVLYRHATSVIDGTADPDSDIMLRGWKFSIESPIDRERFAISDSPLLTQPIRTKHTRAMMTFTQEFQSQSQYTDFLANNDLVPEMVFTSPEAIGGGGSRSALFTFPKSRIVDLDPPVDQFGAMIKEVQYLGIYSAGGDLTSYRIDLGVDQATIALG